MKQLVQHAFVIILSICGVLVSVAICVERLGDCVFDSQNLLPGIGFSNSGPAGGLVALGLTASVSLYRFMDKSKKRGRPLLALSIGMMAIGLVLSESRAAWFAAAVGIISPFWKRFETKRKFLLATAAILMLAFLYILRPASANGRLLIWRVCLEMIADKPFFGQGPNGLIKNYMLYQAEYFGRHTASLLLPYADNNVYAFNELLHVISDWGLIGAAVLCYLIFSRLSAKSASCDNETLKAVMMAWLAFAMFSYPLSQAPLFVVFLSCCILLEGRNDNLVVIRKVVDMLTIFVMVTGVAWFSIGWRLDRKVDALYAGTLDEITERNMFQSGNWWMKYFPLVQGRYVAFCETVGDSGQREEAILSTPENLSMFGVYCAAGDILSSRGAYEEALSLYSKASDMIPLRLRPRYGIFRILCGQGRYDEAKKVGETILSLPIKVMGSEAILIREDVKKTLESQFGLHRAEQVEGLQGGHVVEVGGLEL